MDPSTSLLFIKNTEPLINSIIFFICETTNTSLKDLISKHKKGELVLNRHIAIYFCVLYSNHYSRLSKLKVKFKYKDHSSIIYAVQRIEHDCRIDPTFKTYISELNQQIFTNLILPK